jgi:hypothetical protein
MSNLSSVIKSIQDIMRQDSGVDGDAQRISQLTWLLFLKVFDALEEELELTRDDYKSPLPQAMRWRNWATDPEGITGDALLDFVNNQLFTSLKALSGDAQRNPRGYVVRGEVTSPWQIPIMAMSPATSVAPYLFGSFGEVKLIKPTAVEPGGVRANAFGAGLRLNSAQLGAASNAFINLEYACLK